MLKVLQILLWVITLLHLAPAQAETTTKEIAAAVNTFMHSYAQQQNQTPQQKIKTEIGQLNPSLTLPSCPQKLVVSSTQQQALRGRLSLKVSCPSPQWSLYVPIQIHLYDTIFLSKQPLLKGAAIDATMITSQSTEVTNLTRGYFSQTQQLEGLLAQRTIPAGQVLTPDMLKAKPLIHPQEEVTITLTLNGMTIKTTGIALASGQLGDHIPVQNKSSHIKVEAEIIGDGLVRVNP